MGITCFMVILCVSFPCISFSKNKHNIDNWNKIHLGGNAPQVPKFQNGDPFLMCVLP